MKLLFMFMNLTIEFFCFKFLETSEVYMIEYLFNLSNSLNLSNSMIFDWMSMFFGISMFHFINYFLLYGKCEYMMDDKNINRFMILLLFVVSMFFMILSPNLISLLLGWNGLGLSPYCVVVDYQNFKSYSAGMYSVTNRLGDVALLIFLE